MQRVMILGQPGAGKSYLARRMGEITGLPVVHVDLIHWKPGWIERDREERVILANKEEAKEAWIFEGGLSRTWDNRLTRCDTLIWLNTPFWLRVWRVFRRTLRDYGRNRSDLPENCPERFDPEFWKWIWDTRDSGRDKIRVFFHAAPENKSRHMLRWPSEVERYLKGLRSQND